MTTPALLQSQVEDSAWLASKPGLRGCFSGTGTGKTLTFFEAARIVLARPENADRTIVVVAPPIALRMLSEVGADHLGVTAQIVRSGKIKIDPTARIIVTTYQIAVTRKLELAALNPAILICDEAHALKTVTAKRTKAILGRGGLCESATYTWLATGSPITRHNDDLFPFLCRAGNGRLKALIAPNKPISYEAFRDRFCVTQRRTFPGARYPTVQVVGSRNTTELNELVFAGEQRLAVRRELKDVFDLPPLTVSRLYVDLDWTPELRELVKAADALSEAEIADGIRKNDASLSTLRRRLGEAKVAASITELADRVDSGNSPILVGAWHTGVIDAARDGLRAKGVVVEVIDGRTGQTDRDRIVDAWNRNEIQVLVGQIAACGVSLNLQLGGAHRIVQIERDWSPTIEAQFHARLYRGGQGNAVHVDLFEADTKLDRAVHRISQNKARNAEGFLQQEKEDA